MNLHQGKMGGMVEGGQWQLPSNLTRKIIEMIP